MLRKKNSTEQEDKRACGVKGYYFRKDDFERTLWEGDIWANFWMKWKHSHEDLYGKNVLEGGNSYCNG